MRILFIAPRFHTNQASLVNKLLEEGHQLDFFVLGKGNSEDYTAIKPKVIPISIITRKYIQYFKKKLDIVEFQQFAIPKLFQYYAMIRKFHPDVIVIRGGPEPVYAWFLFPFLFSKTKLVYYTQTPKLVVKGSLLRKTYDYLLSNRYKIKWYTPVLHTSNNTEKLTDLTYMEYLPFFIYPKTVEIIDNSANNTVHFLCVAKYEPRKNLSMLIDVVIKLHQKHKNFRLTIIGSTGTDKREGIYKNIKSKIDGNKLQNFIKLLKNIPHPKMEEYYQKHHVFLMPSIQEPASVSQLEAMANGLAVICSIDNGTAHYIKDKKNGFLIEATPKKLEQAMEKYLLQPSLIMKHRQASLDLVKTDFCIDKNYDKFLEIIQSP
ncbi:glycosyltransferase involved in cell wall biosynthesis [Pedobacter sp. CG_S7]|uniref:glycosyltransferase family 4 protein n=1 Tax=Pedobacter sp. CG_S7 TaxID=3143930 RepID=UPI003396FD01